MILIGVDEAGYGPMLGPLVIVATRWWVPDEDDADSAIVSGFEPFATPRQVAGNTIVVRDSKIVFKRKAGLTGGLRRLHTTAAALCHAAGYSITHPRDLIDTVAAVDRESIRLTPWLRDICVDPFPAGELDSVRDAWQAAPARLVAIKARILTADRFNRGLDQKGNKANLLSDLTLDLVKATNDARGGDVRVYCDRHGGRAYYGTFLRRHFPDQTLNVVTEGTPVSSYRLTGRDQTISIRFTVKGDSFTPVAASSLIAKSIREQLMNSFNAYFARLRPSDPPLRPTAGYATDAKRFLGEIESLIAAGTVDRDALVRRA